MDLLLSHHHSFHASRLELRVVHLGGLEGVDEADDDVREGRADLKFTNFFQQNSAVKFEPVVSHLLKSSRISLFEQNFKLDN